MKQKFYITTPIYYVNASPHIGHSYTTIAADTMARFMRGVLKKENVLFLTGTDEHGQKIQKAADEAGLSAQEFVDKVVVQFKGLWEKLNISYDDFIRTTQQRHITTVQRALQLLYDKKEIYSAKYEGWYCTPCEIFWTQTQLSDSLCPDCKRPLEKIREVNYFFKISAYQGWLIDYIKNNPRFIQPASRQEEVLSFLKINTLSDLCISRPTQRLSWGIPVPFSKEHVTYVWFDALINYISAVGGFDAKGNYVSNWWGDDTQVVHMIGKDILRQHAVYWPIMLKALGIRMPDTVCAHGWWLIDAAKMSKSVGNVVNPLEMVDKYGIDVYRYFLLKDVPFGLDGNFSEEAIVKRFNSDLANDLGNLLYRTLTMIEKYYQGAVPSPRNEIHDERITHIVACLAGLHRQVKDALAATTFNFSLALEKIWEPVSMANKYVEDAKPWNLAKEGKKEELEAFIRILVDVIRQVGHSLSPFMPQTASQIEAQIGNNTINKGQPLFPRIENTR
ncbi:MAG: methionine--tRNA ligase [Candidatus Omnitrophota bacterium]